MIRTGSFLVPMLKNLGIEEGVRLAQIKNNWQRIFDKQLTVHMSPSKLTEGELLINVDSPLWMQQLSYFAQDISAKLKSFGVTSIRFRLGKVSQQKQDKACVVRHTELTEDDQAFVGDLCSRISDSSLQEAVRKAVEQSLSSSGRVR